MRVRSNLATFPQLLTAINSLLLKATASELNQKALVSKLAIKVENKTSV